MASTRISTVIVSFNTRDLLRRCLASLPEGTDRPPLEVEVIVVDNASADGSADMVEREFPRVRLLRSAENLGFARATNFGLETSTGDLLFLLNPDTELLGDALAQLAGFLLSCPAAGVASPALVYPDGSPQHGAFRFPTLWMSFLDFFPLNHRLAGSRLNGRYRTPPDGSPFPIDHPLGAAMLIKRRAWEEVGPLDEGYFMYCEEVDWCIRASRAGWKAYQVPAARVIHHSGQSTGQFREEMLVQLHRSRYRLFGKHYSASFVRAHRAIVRAGILRRMAEARWAAARGRIDAPRLERALEAYWAIWRM